MTKYEPGEIVLIPFPFSDLTGTKKRPALVLAEIGEKQEIICVMLTSIQTGSEYEHSIFCWEEAGLLKPTCAKVHRIFTISCYMVHKKIGKLDKKEYVEILQKALNLFKMNPAE